MLKKIREETFIKEIYSDLNQSKPANPYFLNLWNGGEFHWNLFDHHRSSVIGVKNEAENVGGSKGSISLWLSYRKAVVYWHNRYLTGSNKYILGKPRARLYSLDKVFFFSFLSLSRNPFVIRGGKIMLTPTFDYPHFEA